MPPSVAASPPPARPSARLPPTPPPAPHRPPFPLVAPARAAATDPCRAHSPGRAGPLPRRHQQPPESRRPVPVERRGPHRRNLGFGPGAPGRHGTALNTERGGGARSDLECLVTLGDKR